MKKRRNRSVAVGLIALFVSVAMFAVTILARYAFQNTERYSVGWIKYFTYSRTVSWRSSPSVYW